MKLRQIVFAALVFFIGCAAPQTRLPQKALLKPAIIKEAITITEKLDDNREVKAPDGENWFDVIVGPVPIVVTAPHATSPLRDGKLRFSDGGGTGALAVILNKIAGVTVIYTTYASPSDPNYYDNNTFKDALREIIDRQDPVLLLDLHGSHAFRPYEIDFGIMDGQSLLGNDHFLTDLISILRADGIINLSNNYFGASKHATITKFASNRGVPSIQMEISSTWLTPQKNNLNAHRFAQMLQALLRYINDLKEEICKTRTCE